MAHGRSDAMRPLRGRGVRDEAEADHGRRGDEEGVWRQPHEERSIWSAPTIQTS